MKNFILICFFSIIFQSNYALGLVELEFAQVSDAPNQIIGGKILQSIYAKININAKIVSYPGSRAIEEARTGRIAGEVHRIFKYGELHPTLIRILPAINFIQPTAFSKNKSIKVF